MTKKQQDKLEATISDLPQSLGVYIFRDQKGQPLYVGKANNLKNRVLTYFHTNLTLGPRTSSMVKKIAQIKHVKVESEIEALILEVDLIKRLKPYYNSQWKDDKRYRHIKIFNFQFSISKKLKGQIWPWVTTSRKRDDHNAIHFGPFPEGKTVRQVLKTLRKVFPWCEYKSEAMLKRNKRPCFYYHINQCPGICAGEITLRDYWQVITGLVTFLRGKKPTLIRQYKRQMQALAAEKKFEEASQIRDKIEKIHYITQRFHASSDYIENPNLIEDIRTEEMNSLLKTLYRANSRPLGSRMSRKFRIEAYDISNIQGKLATGSRVVFVNAEPEKSEYRRYKIKIEGQPNDTDMMREVLKRRLVKVDNGRRNNLPDLILLDGGKGQLGVGLAVLKQYNLTIPTIALAKRLEEIYIPATLDEIRKITLPADSPGLQLLQRIRDEAHRFAITYHRKLRARSLI